MRSQPWRCGSLAPLAPSVLSAGQGSKPLCSPRPCCPLRLGCVQLLSVPAPSRGLWAAAARRCAGAGHVCAVLWLSALPSSAAEHRFYFLICNCRKEALGTELFLSSFFLLFFELLPSGACCIVCRRNKSKQCSQASCCRAEGMGPGSAEKHCGSRRVRAPHLLCKWLSACRLSASRGNALCSGMRAQPRELTPCCSLGIAVFSLARLEALAYLSSLQLPLGRELVLAPSCYPAAFGLYPSTSSLPSALAEPAAVSSASSVHV